MKRQQDWIDLDLLFEEQPVMTFAVRPDGTVLAVNKLGAERLGYTSDELVGRSVSQVVVEEDWPLVERHLRQAVVMADQLVMAEFRKRHRDGRLVWVRDSMRCITDRQAQPLLLLCCEDIDALKRTEQALQQANARLLELDRLKTNLVNTVSHELRTPLTSIKGYVEFLLDEVGGGLTAQQRDFASRIEQGADQLEELIDDLLDYARLEAGGLRVVRSACDLVALIQSVIETLDPQARARGVVLAPLAASAPMVIMADERRVRQVLVNLLGNAIKFTAAGGRVWTTLEARDGEACVAVHDEGVGLAPEHMPRLFDRFYQVNHADTRDHGGTGLGLAISKGLVVAHGGTIGVNSPGPGQGSTFWFCLPRA